jgi:hypothetical protein
MSCCGKKDFDSSSFDHCLCDVVKAVKHIQDAGTDDHCDDCPTSCFIKPLGGLASPTSFNTRVIQLLTKTGDPFTVNKPNCMATGACGGADVADESPADPAVPINGPFTCFRIEKIIGECCVLLRAVVKKPAPGGYVWKATNLCITVDIRCFCGIICVADAHVDLRPYY